MNEMTNYCNFLWFERLPFSSLISLKIDEPGLLDDNVVLSEMRLVSEEDDDDGDEALGVFSPAPFWRTELSGLGHDTRYWEVQSVLNCNNKDITRMKNTLIYSN